ncbi:methionine synthase [Anaerovorax odorimutans]|uniref:Methionine synthase n=1 Tax=Anaerovorax odorimutans TaxID=109327 RepID=A0ABT1RSH7_9FIRM|nr:vitamin B12 dependent-methionine synthase activation domain-containing protein [Anaerovorax odorimutans]MCQ4638138.1 methionine synthase [Anaerovorax odorimutans]
MKLERPNKIDRGQWLVRLGVAGEADAALEQSLLSAEEKLLKCAAPQGIYRVLGLDEMELSGKAIKKHLAGCGEMAVMGATLGTAIDNLIRQSQIRDMAAAVILDCGASVLIEQVCDAFETQIREETSGYLTGRYSPGYGDLPIETQDQLIRIIDGPRKIGLTVNQSHIMIPRKSVTAVLGISDQPVAGYLATCEECTLRDKCVLRKEGKNCAGL